MASHPFHSRVAAFVVVSTFAASAYAVDLNTPQLRVDSSVLDLSASLAASVFGEASTACAREDGVADSECLARLLANAFEDGRAKRISSPSLGVVDGEETSVRSDVLFPLMVIDAFGVHETRRVLELALAYTPRLAKDGSVALDVDVELGPASSVRLAEGSVKSEPKAWKATVVLAKEGTAIFRLTRATPINQPPAAGLPLIGGLFRLPDPREVFLFVRVAVELPRV